MSYNCYISFKQMEANEIIPFFQQFKKTILNSLKDIAKDEFSFCPFVRKCLKVKKDFQDFTLDEIEESRNWMTNYVFKHRYFYDADLKLLGVYGVSTAVRHLFDGTVYFQNSCDQDYDRKDWEGIIPFEKIYDKCMNYSIDEIIHHYQMSGYDFNSDYPDVTEKELDYIKKTLCYKEIWDKIGYTLFDEDTALYLSVFGHREYTHAEEFLRACHEAEIKWEKKNNF